MAEDIDSLARRVSALEARIKQLTNIIEIRGQSVTISAHDLTIEASHDLRLTANNDLAVNAAGRASISVMANASIETRGGLSLTAARADLSLGSTAKITATDIEATAGGKFAIRTGGAMSIAAAGALEFETRGSLILHSSAQMRIGSNANLDLDADRGFRLDTTSCRVVATGDLTLEGMACKIASSKDMTLNAEKALAITVADAIDIKTGIAKSSLKKDGSVLLQGKDVTIMASGDLMAKSGGDLLLRGRKIQQN